MAALPEPRLTPEDYLALDRQAEEKNEFIDGVVIGMAGGSEAHDLITGNVFAALRAALQGACRVYTSNMRVQVHPSGMYVYPDVTVVCGPSHLADDHRDTLLNPTLVVEVLSPSTERRDRGRKARLYRALPSLNEYLLIAQDGPYVERLFRQANGQWGIAETDDPQGVVELATGPCRLAMADIYADVAFT